MSCDKDSEISDIKSEKPVKRVRFSDEIKNVYEYELDENVENFSLEDESYTVSNELQNLEQNDFSTEECITDVVDTVNTADTSDSNKCMSECDDNFELTECNKQVTITDDSYKDDCHLQYGDSVGYAGDDSLPVDYFNNNNSNTVDLNSLIRETQHMAISSPEQASEENLNLSFEAFSVYSSCDSNSADNILQVVKQPIETNCDLSCITRKRSSGGMLIERQTSKLNSCLRSNNSEINSAVDLKNAVFNAWNKVKDENCTVKNVLFVPEVKEKIDSPPKIHDRKFENKKYGRLKNSKKSAKKFSFKESEPLPQKKKEDIEESKMAFQAWKKKKDELLNQQIAEKCRKEEKKRLESLMNARMRRTDAESAYLTWISHKAVVFKMEKKKNKWLLERENEKLNEKIKRNDEAAKIYYKWLRSKIFSKRYSHTITEDKPPWTPPGKANSLI